MSRPRFVFVVVTAALIFDGNRAAAQQPEVDPPTEDAPNQPAAEPQADPQDTQVKAAPPAASPKPVPALASQSAALGAAQSADRIRELEYANEDLREEIEILNEDLQALSDRVDKNARRGVKLTGFLDFGFFNVTGDGRGIRSDIGHINFPEYEDEMGDDIVPDSWVFMGDPLSTAVNARGDPANVAESRAITFDGIGASGSSFIVNTVNLGLFAEISENLIFTSKLDVIPRGRDISDVDGLFLGDYIDLRLAYVEYRSIHDWINLSLFAGKFDSVIGFEYRSQEAPTRIEVTPSLICRYTCGYPLGVKARAQFFDDALIANVAVTNGSPTIEGFPFGNEIDANHFKTASGRLSYRVGLAGELELGVSGAFGAQDNQTSEKVYQWLVGADIHYKRHDLVIRGEYVQGRAEGDTAPGGLPCGLTQCLEFRGAYGLAGYRVTNVIMPFVRIDWRDALHENGASFVYISELIRGTAGLNLVIGPRLIIKGQYTVNRELGRLPQFPNDVFASSMVIKY